MSVKMKILSAVLAVLLLSGCSMGTLDELYRVPKRSEEYNNLQSAIDKNMGGRELWAPLSGENLQTVQMADLDGDGKQEYLLFAKSAGEKPLHILIFRLENGEYVLADVIQNAGSAYDVVEYARVDDKPGYELIVGCQISDQVSRSVSVYTFRGGKALQLMDANYNRFLSYDINADGRSELMVLRPGESDEANGLAELYFYTDGGMERSNQVSMSQPADQIKRIVAGKLHGGQSAVYVASAVGENAIITDVYTQQDGHFINVSFSNESSTSVQTLRNYYVYADDIDDDGVVELPDLITMRSPLELNILSMQYLIRWYALTPSGGEVDKAYTYHNFRGGWYMTLDGDWASRVAVVQRGNTYEFYVWDEAFAESQKLFTVYTFSASDREEQGLKNNRFVLYRTDELLYAADLDVSSAGYGITQDTLIRSFHLIHQDWKTGET